MKAAAILLFLCAGASAVPVKFLAVGRPSFLKIRGACEGSVLKHDKVSDAKGTVGKRFIAEVKIDSCDTGISLRNRHMRENYMHTDRFPKAILEGTVWEGSEAFSGTLTVHGKPSDVSGEISGGVLKFKTKLSSHGVQTPNYKGVTVADDVEIEAPLSF